MNKKQILSYEELYEAYLIASQERYKYKEVIDKIKEYAKEVLTWYTNEEITDEIANHILELLEEIE